MTDDSGIHGDAADQPTRRRVLGALAAAGLGTTMLHRAIAQQADGLKTITADTIRNAEWVAGIELSDEQREEAVATVRGVLQKRKQLRAIKVDYDTLPCLRFDPEMVDEDARLRSLERPAWLRSATVTAAKVEQSQTDYAFLSIRQLGGLLRAGKVTSVALTQFFLNRLQQQDPTLKCVVTLTEKLALRQAAQADRELSAGRDRGPLHGIPWGAKDLIAVEGYPTTWGAPEFRNRELPRTATVAKRLEHAGAVLIAKLSLGALAMGDQWFGGQTRNPWNPEQGSSGSSAGSAAAVAAGLVPFTLGSETLGSIVSPCRRCGVTGLRSTFGRVSRKDCMALSWTMDKIGPIARSIDDCAVVFHSIHGADPGDPSSVDRWFGWPVDVDLSQLRIGQVEGVPVSKADEITLQTLAELGASITPISLPREFPEWAISLMLDAEAAEIFHDLSLAEDTEGLNRWPAVFRKLHFLTAVDYLHAARLRLLLMEAMVEVFKKVDLYVGGDDLGICNLTGHPTVVFPTRMSEDEEHSQPLCSTLTGRLYDEATLLSVARLVETDLSLGRVVPTHGNR